MPRSRLNPRPLPTSSSSSSSITVRQFGKSMRNSLGIYDEDLEDDEKFGPDVPGVEQLRKIHMGISKLNSNQMDFKSDGKWARKLSLKDYKGVEYNPLHKDCRTCFMCRKTWAERINMLGHLVAKTGNRYRHIGIKFRREITDCWRRLRGGKALLKLGGKKKKKKKKKKQNHGRYYM